MGGVFQSIPLFFLALLVLGFLGPGLDILILLLGIVSWDQLARVVRAETLSVRQREFVEAARASGASDRRIMVRHIFPNVPPAANVVVSLIGSRVILIEGGAELHRARGSQHHESRYLIYNAQSFLSVAWWMSVFPGVAIAVAVLKLNLLGDVVNEVLDPSLMRSRPRRGVSSPSAAGRR